jgi:replicative DNA helicase
VSLADLEIENSGMISEDFGRTPPQDLAAEQSVIGGMLLSKDAIADVIEVLRGPDFYRPAHEFIFEAILDLYGRGEPADAVTVVDELTKRGELGRVGGPAYLHTLLSSVPTAANAGYYARIVRDHAVRRRLVTAGTKIVQMGYATDGGDFHSIVDGALAEIGNIGDELGDTQRKAVGESALSFDRAVTAEVDRMRIRDAAQRQLKADQRPVIPKSVLLTELLAEPDEPEPWRIHGLLKAGGRVILAAQRKAGKTTMVTNLVRALADGEQFLGRFDSVQAKHVTMLDFEMSRQQIKGWLRTHLSATRIR